LLVAGDCFAGNLVNSYRFVSGTTCTEVISQTAENYQVAYSGNTGQMINNALPRSICTIKLKQASEYGSALTGHLEIWSDIARAGTKYGGSSDVITSSSSPPTYVEKTYTFADKPNPSGNYYIHFVPNSGTSGQNFFRVSSETSSYSTTSYDMFKDGADINYDMYFKVSYDQ
jgi:hypothetical protein